MSYLSHEIDQTHSNYKLFKLGFWGVFLVSNEDFRIYKIFNRSCADPDQMNHDRYFYLIDTTIHLQCSTETRLSDFHVYSFALGEGRNSILCLVCLYNVMKYQIILLIFK